MGEIYVHTYTSPLGELLIGAYQDHICLIDFVRSTANTQRNQRIPQALNDRLVSATIAVHLRVCSELDQYFAGSRTHFTVPTQIWGTEFQKQVWNAISQVAYGATTSYSRLACAVKSPRAVRAVAQAARANPLCVIIPCHRVIGKDGRLTGYAGGLTAKRTLLQLEGAMPTPKCLC